MATFIDAAPTNMFHKGLFGTLSQSSLSYLQSQMENLSTLGGSFGTALYEKSKQAFEAINGHHAVASAKALIAQTVAFSHTDEIRPLLSLVQLQTAQPVMQHWIMTEPTLRQAFYDGKCEGYVDTYVDPEPERVGEQMRAWRVLHDGVCNHNVQGDHGWEANLYHEPLGELETPLEIRDIAAIFQSQHAALMAYEAGEEDPTSQYGASLT